MVSEVDLINLQNDRRMCHLSRMSCKQTLLCRKSQKMSYLNQLSDLPGMYFMSPSRKLGKLKKKVMFGQFMQNVYSNLEGRQLVTSRNWLEMQLMGMYQLLCEFSSLYEIYKLLVSFWCGKLELYLVNDRYSLRNSWYILYEHWL